ncbi:MAG: type II and III secretion system protein, partial [Myxococcales bacterium]|nr:type II and III secretion system protein [Myxococcales bacterium]
VVRQVRVTERDNIRLDFYFVELSRDSGYRVGIGWPGTIGGTAGMTIDSNLRGTTSTAATLATEVLPRLDLAQDSEWARVLREASLIIANGEAGSFESAGELNFRIESAVATSIQQIIFGSRIDVQPKYDRTTGRLDIKIKATVSELTNIGSDGLPGRSYTNLDTLVNLKLGQSVVLAGIHGKSSGRASEGLPLLSQIPVLGALFGSKTFRETEVENLIFIVPTVVQAVKANKRIEIDDALEAFRKYSGGVDGTFLDRKMRPRSKATSKDK